MAISTIKYDANGDPFREKYRIVALGNMDPIQWSRSQCYAPVLALAEMRFIVSIAIKHGIPLKSGDVIQAFCQKEMPTDENMFSDLHMDVQDLNQIHTGSYFVPYMVLNAVPNTGTTMLSNFSTNVDYPVAHKHHVFFMDILFREKLN